MAEPSLTLTSLDKVAEIVDRLPSLQGTIVVSYVEGAHYAHDLSKIRDAVMLRDFLRPFSAQTRIALAQLPFNHPVYIMYSSGTTGGPKCIIHGAGGVLLQHLKEHKLHCDLKPGDRLFYFTTCGWMMWNWLTSGLASGTTVGQRSNSGTAPPVAGTCQGYARSEISGAHAILNSLIRKILAQPSRLKEGPLFTARHGVAVNATFLNRKHNVLGIEGDLCLRRILLYR